MITLCRGCGGGTFEDDPIARLEFFARSFPRPIRMLLGKEGEHPRRCLTCLPDAKAIVKSFSDVTGALNHYAWEWVVVVWKSGKTSEPVQRKEIEFV